MTDISLPNADAIPGADSQPWPACRLTRLIGKTSDQWTVDDLVGVVGTLGIRLVSLMHVGGDGWLKTLDFVPRDLPHLREVLSFGERADGETVAADSGGDRAVSGADFRRLLARPHGCRANRARGTRTRL